MYFPSAGYLRGQEQELIKSTMGLLKHNHVKLHQTLAHEQATKVAEARELREKGPGVPCG